MCSPLARRRWSRTPVVTLSLLGAALAGGAASARDCDPALPGRPAADGTSDRVLRGFIVGWAVNLAGEEIRWNHLSAATSIVNYAKGTSYDYEGVAVQVVDTSVDNGDVLANPGVLDLNGIEYAQVFDQLLVEFEAHGSTGYSTQQTSILATPELTLHPVSLDLNDGGAPVITKAHIDVWNENEVKFSGSYRCVNCWDSTLLHLYDFPNHYKVSTLQSNRGKARIDGIASPLCEDSVDDPLTGVLSTCSTFNDVTLGDDYACRAVPVKGLGYESAQIAYRPVGGEPPENPEESGGGQRFGAGDELGEVLATMAPEIDGILGRHGPIDPASESFGEPSVKPNQKSEPRRRRPAPPPPPPQDGEDKKSPPENPGPLVAQDRASTAEKGSLFILSKVELRWDHEGQLIQDTFIQLTNDFPENVKVLMYFVNGDPPTEEIDCERAHPGWNWLDNMIELTGNEPTWWSVLTGQPKGVSPFQVLDPID